MRLTKKIKRLDNERYKCYYRSMTYDGRGRAMEEVKKTVNFSKSGSGSYTPKTNLPMEWVKDMQITKEENKILMIYDREKKEIIIKKLIE